MIYKNSKPNKKNPKYIGSKGIKLELKIEFFNAAVRFRSFNLDIL